MEMGNLNGVATTACLCVCVYGSNVCCVCL